VLGAITSKRADEDTVLQKLTTQNQDYVGVIRGWRNYKHEEYWQSMHGQSNLRAFLEDSLIKS